MCLLLRFLVRESHFVRPGNRLLVGLEIGFSRKGGMSLSRAIVAPWPSIVMLLPIGGRPFGPYQSLSIRVKL